MTEASLSKGHPIESLETIRALYKSAGIKIRVRFRGPRRKHTSGRISFVGKLTCLKKDARTFSVYTR